MLDASIVTAIRNYPQALQQHGVAVCFGVVFGSQLAGKADVWSDIDVLVVSPRFDTPYNHHTVDLLWHLSARVDSQIEPLPYVYL
jgi:predicted nucleotidyltransferase